MFYHFHKINSTQSRDPTYARSGKALSENEIVTSLPTENEERSSRLFEMATESVNEFLKSHSLQFKLPEETTQEVSRALEEGEIFIFTY